MTDTYLLTVAALGGKRASRRGGRSTLDLGGHSVLTEMLEQQQMAKVF